MTRFVLLAGIVSSLLCPAGYRRADAAEASQLASTRLVVESRPRLLLRSDDLPQLRIRCGIDGYRNPERAAEGAATFASHRIEFLRLRRFVDESLGHDALPGTLYGPALMHLLTGTLGKPDRYSTEVTRQLLTRQRFGVGSDDAVVAFDWCFDAIPAPERATIAANLTATIREISLADNPFNHIRFHSRLCSLAAAITLDGVASAGSTREARVNSALTAGAAFLRGPFVRFLTARGAMATAPANGIHENADACFAVEIWRTGTGEDLWPTVRDSLGRSAEPAFWMRTDYPGHEYGFLHDDGANSPLDPRPFGFGFTPAAALVVAERTDDPVGAWLTRPRVRPDDDLSTPTPQIDSDRHSWFKILYGRLGRPVAQRILCPRSRNLGGGWVVMRTGWGRDATVLLFDAGQSLLRSRQHFDAGNFQIFHQGLLTHDAGDDVVSQTTFAKGGSTGLGQRSGDWDDFAQATIAHNCVTVYDALRPMRRYGRRWPARGNQRLVEGDATLDSKPIEQTDRHTGRLLAFETNVAYSYAAADLAAAYDETQVLGYTRQILLLNVGLILVVDRVETVKTSQTKTWHLQLPNRPTVDGNDLDDTRRILGRRDAGIWDYFGRGPTLTTDNHGGRLFVQTLAPDGAEWRIVGGPKKPAPIPEGRYQNRAYFGGDPNGFEHWIVPAHTSGGSNAWFRLGKPTRLGEQFGLRAGWGRLDVRAPLEDAKATFVHLIIPVDRNTPSPPKTTWRVEGGTGVLTGTFDRRKIRVVIALEGEHTGQVTLTDTASDEIIFEKALATTVHPSPPLPTRP